MAYSFQNLGLGGVKDEQAGLERGKRVSSAEEAPVHTQAGRRTAFSMKFFYKHRKGQGKDLLEIISLLKFP